MLQNAYQMVLFLEIFRPNYEFFWQNQKTLTMEKLETMMKKVFFREKKRFHLFENLLYKNGQTQNMPVVAGRLVLFSNP